MEKNELVDKLYDVSIQTFHDNLHYNCFELGVTKDSIEELVDKMLTTETNNSNNFNIDILEVTNQHYKNMLAEKFDDINMMVSYVKHYGTISDPHGCVKRNMMTSLDLEFNYDVDRAVNDGLAQSITIDLAENIDKTLQEDYCIDNLNDLKNKLSGLSQEQDVFKRTNLDESTVDRINYHNRQVYNELKEQGGVSTYFKLADDIENKIYKDGGLNYNLIGDLDIVEYNCTPMDFAKKYEENPHYNDFKTLNPNLEKQVSKKIKM